MPENSQIKTIPERMKSKEVIIQPFLPVRHDGLEKFYQEIARRREQRSTESSINSINKHSEQGRRRTDVACQAHHCHWQKPYHRLELKGLRKWGATQIINQDVIKENAPPIVQDILDNWCDVLKISIHPWSGEAEWHWLPSSLRRGVGG